MNIAEKLLLRMFVMFFAMLFLQMTCLAGQSNLVLNSTVETGSPASWTSNLGAGTATFSWSTTQYVSSSHSLKIVMSSATGCADWRQFFSSIDVTATYRFRAHIYATNVAADSHSMEIQWFNGGTYLRADIITSTTANSWVEANLRNITPPANATCAYLLLRSYKVGTYYFDDIVFKREDKDLITVDGQLPLGIYTLPETQLLTNPDMEWSINETTTTFLKGNGISPKGWTPYPYSGGPTLVWDTARYSSGAHSIKLTMTSSGLSDWRQKVTSIIPGASYILDAQIYATNVAAGSHGVEVQWFNASDSYLGYATAASSSANTWSNVTSGAVTAPAGTSYAWILCRGYFAGAYNFDMVKLTKNLSYAERLADAYNAGFNFIWGSDGMLSDINSSGSALKVAYVFYPNYDLMYQPTGQDPAPLIDKVTTISSSSPLSIWLGPDEFNWRNPEMTSAGIVNGCNIVKNNDSYYSSAPHKIWLNMASYATPAAPADFTTVKPFCTAADIISVDIYPVPNGNGQSILADQTISCVGKYVDTLYNDVASDGGTQRRVIWMMLQGGFDWGWSNTIDLQWFDANNNPISIDSYQVPSTGAWQEIADSNIRPPAGATSVYVLARTYYNGTYYFDDIYFSTGGNNLLLNSDMETGSPAEWDTFSDGRGAPSQTWYYDGVHGNYSLKTVMNGCGTADWRQQVTGINPANTYSLSALVQASSLKMPLPTWTQTRFMAYDAIIHGARGLYYFKPALVTIDSSAWGDMKNIATEIHSLSNVLTSYISFRTVTVSNANIETLLMEYNGKLYLLAANTSSSSTGNVTFTVSGLSLSSPATVLFESRTKSITSGHQFIDTFSGYQVHVYEITKQ